MDIPDPTKIYTEDEKQHMLDNLDIEVAHRSRQIESYISDALETFRIRAEGHISRIPHQVRSMSMRDFSCKYHGDIQAALRGLQREKMGGDLSEIDKTTRKRKWVAIQEVEGEAHRMAWDGDNSKAVKNARLMPSSPIKKPGSSTGPGTEPRARLLAVANKTPGTSRTMGRIPSVPSPSPSKLEKCTHPRPVLSAKPPPHPHLNGRLHNSHVPSSSNFNPTIPKTPSYPARLPRRDESMLSLNGSPLANPYELGLGWFAGIEVQEKPGDEGGGTPGLKKSKSIINIRRDPSIARSHSTTHSRTNSESTNIPPSSNHSLNNSNTQPNPHSQPPPQYRREGDVTPRPFPSTGPVSYHPVSALVAIPTSDGHLLEFDPLQTSPGALDALDGITNSAKRGAREEMGRLVKMAVERWKIG